MRNKDIFRASVNSINQRITKGITKVKEKDKQEIKIIDSSSDSSSISFRVEPLKRRNSIKKKRFRRHKPRSRLVDPGARLSSNVRSNKPRQTLLNLQFCGDKEESLGDRFKSFHKRINESSRFSNIPILEEAKKEESSKKLMSLKRQNTVKQANLSISNGHSSSMEEESDCESPSIRIPILENTCGKLEKLKLREFSPIEIKSGRRNKDEIKDIVPHSPQPAACIKMSSSNMSEVAKRLYCKVSSSNLPLSQNLSMTSTKNMYLRNKQLQNIKSEENSELDRELPSTKNSTYKSKFMKSLKKMEKMEKIENLKKINKIEKMGSFGKIEKMKESIVDKILKSDRRIEEKIKDLKKKEENQEQELRQRNFGSRSQVGYRTQPRLNMNTQQIININTRPMNENMKVSKSPISFLKRRRKNKAKESAKSELEMTNMICRFANCQSPNRILYSQSPREHLVRSRQCVKSVGNLTMLFV